MSVEENIVTLRLAVKELQDHLHQLETELKDLCESFTSHDHPYKPEPRYGGAL